MFVRPGELLWSVNAEELWYVMPFFMSHQRTTLGAAIPRKYVV